MDYFKQMKLNIEGIERSLYITDNAERAGRLRDMGEPVAVYLHEGNREQDFSGFLYAVEEPEELDAEYAEKVCRRLLGLPWNILETARCLVRETTPEDVEDFYEIYSNPEITKYMEDLYPEKEQEKAYIREYIEKVYTFFEFGVWTVVEKESGRVIGRAGFSYREGYEEPELGFIIGVPWQRKGYAEEVCRAILKYGEETLGFKVVQTLVETENEPSVRLCRKLNFCDNDVITMGGRDYYRFLRNATDCYLTSTMLYC